MKKGMYPGGNEFNIAYHAAKNGTQAAFMGVFTREDPLSLILYHTLEEAGVDLSHSHFQNGDKRICYRGSGKRRPGVC
mgnify:CR=1 FL=1